MKTYISTYNFLPLSLIQYNFFIPLRKRVFAEEFTYAYEFTRVNPLFFTLLLTCSFILDQEYVN